ncbi:phosphoribosyltransferase family protein [Nitrosomonas sp.]|uniref:ComF family protein n=1 Tax=Nitrosomonas sp. TaxID=42353 RepID=UPI0025F8E6B2|nr:phosphoribosyltransferase family protein [Nitrosomonas sp.]MCC6916297.1 ComF family protein [Nitrosomonas sp.]
MSIFPSVILNSRLNFTQLFNHKYCVLCLAPGHQAICHACLQDLPGLPPAHCPSCLLPTPSSEICGTCLRNPPAWNHIRAALRYTFPVDALVQALKYRADLPLAPVLANLLLTRLQGDSLPDYIIPVPLHPDRLRERGFNQALEISRYLSKQTGCRLLPAACIRTRRTPSQTELPLKKRLQNVRNAFSCGRDFSGKRVAIVDDVMTSGSTLNELAGVIRRQGAAEVYAWAVARAFPGKPFSGTKTDLPENLPKNQTAGKIT